MEQNTKEPNREAELLIACHEEVVANLKAELAALRRDKERLDWLEASPSDRLAEVRRLLFLRCETARESIDAAMKEGRT